MISFLARRIGITILTIVCLTFIVFLLTNLDGNLVKLAKFMGNQRMTQEQVDNWLDKNGFNQPDIVRYGEWLGVLPSFRNVTEENRILGRCSRPGVSPEDTPEYCGIIQGNWGWSVIFKDEVGSILATRLKHTGWLMFYVMLVMVPFALVVGVLAGMREGSKTDRTLSTFSIITTSTPEYVSGVILVAIFASSAIGLKWFKGSASSALNDITFENFTLPVVTMALYGMGYIARMTRASMAEVMTSQYIRTARLKGLSFPAIVLKHAIRNSLIAPFTVIMLQFPWLLTGVVIVETLFNYKGFGWLLVQAASNNDINLLMGCSIIAVIVVLFTQLISDIGYVYLNPRIRIS
ncbi:MAG: ABC transporter permease [Rhodobacteraceae bacterium]|nr:ABC transporter permease [Paracoccaceae bacterium]